MKQSPDSTIRLIQISDCHLSADPAALYRGINADESLQRLLPAIKAFQPHGILATGDLSQDTSALAYQRLNGYLRTLNSWLIAIPGNHDHPTRLKQYLNGQTSDRIELDHWRIIGLNSYAGDCPQGALPEESLTRLMEIPTDKPVLLAIHHHPCAVGTAWADRFPLTNGGELLELLDRLPQVKALCFGHIHHVWQGQRRHYRLLSAPATSINTLPGCERFTADQLGPAARWLRLNPDGRLRSGILRPARAAIDAGEIHAVEPR